KPINPSVTEEPASLFGGFGINPGGQLLNAAIGVTRAVSQFLGVALQGAAKSFTSAFRPQPLASEAAADELSYYRYSGGYSVGSSLRTAYELGIRLMLSGSGSISSTIGSAGFCQSSTFLSFTYRQQESTIPNTCITLSPSPMAPRIIK
uniref:Uncharacterized protein n=1 Tax=Anopheles maculatus TaxID=74869 RepID=A0A182T299_9DIPT